jgi:ABC-type lipoprotein release transport system permease subunit
MTLFQLALAGLRYYRRSLAAVVFGVASAVAVLSGSFLVGSSVRHSLAALTLNRIGHTGVVVGAEQPFTESLDGRLSAQPGLAGAAATPLFSLDGTVQHQNSGRRAGHVSVYGVDDRFFRFHRVDAAAPDDDRVLLSPDLAAELAPEADDAVLVRVARPTDIPLDSLHGRKDDVGRSIRLTYSGVLAPADMGEFSLAPSQGPMRAAFVSLDRVQRDLEQAGRVNTLLLAPGQDDAPVATPAVRDALDASLTAEDVGLQFALRPEFGAVIVESASGLLADPIVSAVRTAAASEGAAATPILTWLATTMTVGDRTLPYSLISAIAPAPGTAAAVADALAGAPSGGPPPIVLNDWAARDLGASIDDPIDVAYYRWADEGQLVTDRTTFRVAGVVPIAGLAADPRLAPDYPGITNAGSFADWDPPFPIDLRLVRPADDQYWEDHRTTPKAFVRLEDGQALWRTRYGQVSSIRLYPADSGADLGALAERLRDAAAREVGPLAAGFSVVDVRSQNLTAAVGATDFGAYFSYFSFFLMVSALLLAALFFRLGIEQRLSQIGVLRAVGYPLKTIRRLFLIEGGIIAVAGGAVGIVLAVAWAWLMMYGLRTWWSGAVGTTRLELYLDPISLVGGAAAGIVAAVVSIALTIRSLNRSSPRQQLAGSHEVAFATPTRSRLVAVAAFTGAVVLSGLSLAGLMPAAGGFFGAGGLVLVGGLAAFRRWLGRAQTDSLAGAGPNAVARLGVRNASWRPGRSLTAAGLVAAAVFLLVSVDSFRKGGAEEPGPHSGTGGFALIAESALPMIHDPQASEGREGLGLQYDANDPDLAGVTLLAARLRAGDDASCLNLYRPQRPRVLGVSPAFVEADRFRFGSTLASTDGERQNPWRLLGPADAEGVVPAIVDQTSLQYVLHAAVGDVITIDEDTARPVRLRVVAALSDTVLQGEIMIHEDAFRAIFPDVAGYRVLLADIADPTPERIDAVASLLEDRLDAYGVDAQETARRLAAFHTVENTYLSTFQTLGGLGLVLGCLGLAAVIARNVLERRRELALLGAAGYSGRQLQTLVMAENLTLVAAGLGIGLIAAVVAIGPVLWSRGGVPPVLPLVWLVIVGAAGLLASAGATRSVRRMPLVPSLRSE